MFGWREETVGAVGGEPPTTGGRDGEPSGFFAEPPPQAVTARHAQIASAAPIAQPLPRAAIVTGG